MGLNNPGCCWGVLLSTMVEYFEQVCPIIMNKTFELTPVADDKDFTVFGDGRKAEGLVSVVDAEALKKFIHIVGTATNTYAYANGLDCTDAAHNQWQINIDNGAYSDLVNGSNADGQMLDNDWRTPLEGSIVSFHLMFDITDQLSNIDGILGIKLKDAKSLQSSLYVTAYIFLRTLYHK